MKRILAAATLLATSSAFAGLLVETDQQAFTRLDNSIKSNQKAIYLTEESNAKLNAAAKVAALGISVYIQTKIELSTGNACNKLSKDVEAINGVIRRLAPQCVDLKKTLEALNTTASNQAEILKKAIDDRVAAETTAAALKVGSQEYNDLKALYSNSAALAEAQAGLAENKALKLLADTKVQIETGLIAQAKLRYDVNVKVCIATDISTGTIDQKTDTCIKKQVAIDADLEIKAHILVRADLLKSSANYDAKIRTYQQRVSKASQGFDAALKAELDARNSVVVAKKAIESAAQSAVNTANNEVEAFKKAYNTKLMGECPNYVPRIVNWVCNK